MTNEFKHKPVRKRFRLDRKYPADLHSHFVSDIVVQHTEDQFTLSFFEIWLPSIIVDSDEELENELDTIEKVEAKCVARLVVTPSKMREFVKAMTENLENFDEMIKAIDTLKEGLKND